MCFVKTYSLDNPIYYVRRLHCSASNPMDREVRVTLDTVDMRLISTFSSLTLLPNKRLGQA